MQCKDGIENKAGKDELEANWGCFECQLVYVVDLLFSGESLKILITGITGSDRKCQQRPVINCNH